MSPDLHNKLMQMCVLAVCKSCLQNMPLYLYYQKRKVQAYINSNQQPAFGNLLAAIRKHGWMGCKLFAWAALETDKQLRVFTEPLPSQTQSW
jgi:hypothetical protein